MPDGEAVPLATAAGSRLGAFMIKASPRQALLLLDVQSTISQSDVLARLPKPEDGTAAEPTVFRLQGRLAGAWPMAGEPGESDWQGWARQVGDLVRRLQEWKKRQGDGPVKLYVAGEGVIPLFVHLGRLLSDWASNIWFLDLGESGGDQSKWTQVSIQPMGTASRSQSGRRDQGSYFDQKKDGTLAADPTKGGRCALLLSNRGLAIDHAAVDRLWESDTRHELRPQYAELSTSDFRPLTSDNVDCARHELTQWSHGWLALLPADATLTLVVTGSPLLAFTAGLALPTIRPLEVPYLSGHRFRPGLRLPLPASSSTGQTERIQVCLAYAPAQQNKGVSSPAELRKHLKPIQDGESYTIKIVDLENVPPGSPEEDTQRLYLQQSDLIVAFVSTSFFEKPFAKAVRACLEAGSVIPVCESPVLLTGRWENVKLFPADGKPVAGRRPADRDARWAELAAQIQERAQQIAARKTQQRLLETRAPDTRRTSGVLRTAATVPEYLDALADELADMPHLRCTEKERYDAWYGLVGLVDRLRPERRIKEQLEANRPETAAALRRLDPTWPMGLTQPPDPLRFMLDQLETTDAKRWLYLGIAEVGQTVRFPYHNGADIDLLAHFRASYPADSRNNEQWLIATELVYTHDCPGLLGALARQYEPPMDELRQAILLLHAFRAGEHLPPLPRDLSAIRSAMLLNVIAAQAWMRDDRRLAFDAYSAAQKRAAHDGHYLAEWVAVAALCFLVSSRWFFDTDLKEDIEASDFGALTRRREELETKPVVARFRHYVSRLYEEARAGLLECMQRALSEPLRIWHQDWHRDARLLLQDQEEQGQGPGLVGNTVELLTSAVLLTPDGVYETTYSDGVDLLCRYGHSKALKTLNEARLFYAGKTDPAGLFRQVLRGGRTPGEWFACHTLLAKYMSDIPLSQLSQAHVFYRSLCSQSFLRGEDVSYFCGSQYSTSAIVPKLNDFMSSMMLLGGLDAGSTAFLRECFTNLPPRGQVAFLTQLHILGDTSWFDCQPADAPTLAELGQCILEFFKSEQGTSRRLQGPEDLHRVPLGLPGLLNALGRVAGTARLQDGLRDALCDQLCAGLKSDFRRFYHSATLGNVLRALCGTGPSAGDRLERVVAVLLDQLSQRPFDLDVLDAYSVLVQRRKLLSSEHCGRLWRRLQDREGEVLALREEPGAARPVMWICAALMGQGAPELRALGRKFLDVCPADPMALAALVCLPTADLDEHQAAVDAAICHTLRGLPENEMPWLSATASPPARRYFDGTPNTVHGIHGVHNHLLCHPQRKIPRRWISLSLQHLFSNDNIAVHTALMLLNRALICQPDLVNSETALAGLSHVLRNGSPSLRDNALMILIRHRAPLERQDVDAVHDALAPYSPPATLGTQWAWRVGQQSQPQVQEDE